MKNILKNKLDNISIAIINNKKEIQLNLMKK